MVVKGKGTKERVVFTSINGQNCHSTQVYEQFRRWVDQHPACIVVDEDYIASCSGQVSEEKLTVGYYKERAE